MVKYTVYVATEYGYDVEANSFDEAARLGELAANSKMIGALDEAPHYTWTTTVAVDLVDDE